MEGRRQEEEDDDSHHHQKPPPPYEEVSGSTGGSGAVADDQRCHHLSIENPMAEVFANAQFDHVELKICGPINPDQHNVHNNQHRQQPRMSGTAAAAAVRGALANLARKQTRQAAFTQWREWRRPEVNLLRLATLALLLLVAVSVARLVWSAGGTVMMGRTKDSPPLTSAAAAAAAHPLKVHSARTGKALSSLLLAEPDLQDRQDQFEPEAATATKTIRTRLEEPDQDLIMPDADVPPEQVPGDAITASRSLAAAEKEPPIPEQELLDHHQQPPEKEATLPTTVISHRLRVTATPTEITVPSMAADKHTSTKSTTSRWSEVPSTTVSNIRTSGSTTTTTRPVTSTTVTPASAAGNTASPTYNISIIIHSANVPDMDSGYLMGRASDTYCNVFIDDVLVGKTPIIDNSNNPSWHYLLPRQFPVRKDTWIRIELMDSDHVRNDHIGGILLNFGDLLKNGSINKPINMFHGRGYIWVTISSQNL